MTGYKQAIVLKKDLELSVGKKISQACHASLKSYKSAEKKIRDSWESEGAKKIALKSDSLEDLRNRAEDEGLSHGLVTDAGMTEVQPGTVTALGIGPGREEKINRVTGELELID